jgi:FAD/FMN-containing dehydrogenase/Fe-S oxidoreductase
MTKALAPAPQPLLDALRSALPAGAEVHGDALHRGLYATDASIYQQIPVAVVVPRTREEVALALRVARERGVPILARGGGTSLAGQTTGTGVVLDFSKHLNRLLEVDAERREARVEPGLIRDALNETLRPHGLMFAPETSTSNRAALGGMIGNDSSGMMSVRYGKTSAHVVSVEALLADGSEVHLGPSSEPPRNGREAKLRLALLALAEENRALIEARFPKVMRSVGGYALNALLEPNPNFARLLCGSEGTLALTLEARVKLVPIPKAVGIVAIHFADFADALKASPRIVAHKPLSVELIDGPLIDLARVNPASAALCGFVEGNPAAVLFVEADADTPEEAAKKLDIIEEDVRALGTAGSFCRAATEGARLQMHALRKLALGLVQRMPGDAKPISFIEDSCVPVEKMADFIEGLEKICVDEGLKRVVYGHASVAVLHFKPVLNLKSAEDLQKMERVSSRAMELVRSMGGAWSGEHGDGIIRGWKNLEFWGEEVADLFRQTKRLFDPEGLLNPGKIIDTPRLTEHQRYGPDYKATWDAQFFHFRGEGGFRSAVEMCNGTGVCRKLGAGTMCPSYMATRDEEHSTRGRANALRLAMSGQLGPDAMTGEELHGALDLCLECKACRSECPSNVDMAKMKSEHLAAYHAKHGASPRDYLFAYMPDAARVATGFKARIVNLAMTFSPARRAIAGKLGIAPERRLPAFATRSLESHLRNYQPRLEEGKEVALFLDTYSNFFEPEIGLAMIRVLERLGCHVTLSKAGCCCRPLISKGFLEEAKKRGAETLRRLDDFARRGVPVVVLEPSCLSALRDDLPDLIDDAALGQRVATILTPPDKLIDDLIRDKKAPKLSFSNEAPRFLLHGHCHQKALDGTAAVRRVLEGAGGSFAEIPSGCCGMAGSFGYEAEHFALSQKIGEDRLFPTVRAADAETILIANGFSCRHQIAEATGRQPLHFAQALDQALETRDGAS